MGFKKKAEALLFPVALIAGIVTGIAIERTKRKAASVAAREAAIKEEFPAEAGEAVCEEVPAEACEAACGEVPAEACEAACEEPGEDA